MDRVSAAAEAAHRAGALVAQPAFRSHLAAGGAIIGAGILAVGLVSAPSDIHAVRADNRVVQLAAFVSSREPAPKVSAVVPVTSGGVAVFPTASRRVNSAGVVTAYADGDVTDILGQVGSFIQGYAILVGFVALAAFAVVFIAPVNFAVSLVQQLLGVYNLPPGTATASTETNQVRAKAAVTQTASAGPSARRTGTKSARVEAPSAPGLAKPHAQSAASQLAERKALAGADRQGDRAHRTSVSTGPAAKDSGSAHRRAGASATK